MTWCSKETQTPFDHQPIEGLFFVIGERVAAVQGYPLEGMKSPRIVFPSGLERGLYGMDCPLVQLLNSLDLPLFETHNEALITAQEWNEVGCYSVFPVSDNRLELWDHDTETVYLVTYDNQDGRMADLSVSEP